jgi:hypothetical protein
MDPVTLIVTALAAGAASALQDDAKESVKAAYARLRGKITKRFSGRKVGGLALAEHEGAPDMWEPQLRAELAETGAADDPDLVGAAQVLMSLVDEAGALSGKYVVSIQGGQGVQVGDHNTQTNYFGRQ